MRIPKQLDHAASRWLLPSGAPAARQRLFTLSQPVLRRACHARDFQFLDATLLLVSAGRLALDDGRGVLEASDAASVVLVPRSARMDVVKSPGEPEGVFRSVFMTFSQHMTAEFHRLHPSLVPAEALVLEPRKIPLDGALADTLSYCLRGLAAADASDREQAHRLMGVLIALADRGHQFARPIMSGVADRLRDILKDDPSRPWTAPEAGRALAMSEATLRRRLAREHARFEEVLADVRMHHAMMLLQTTRWSIPRVAEACGYRTRTRFAERFRERFGCLPSQAR